MHLKDSNMIYAIIHPEKVKQIEAGDYKFIYSVFVNSPGDDEPAHEFILFNQDRREMHASYKKEYQGAGC